MAARHAWLERSGRVLGPLSVLALSLGLLTYVEFGEAHRLYPHIVLRRIAVQGEIIQGAVEPLLRAGLALEQFAAFPSMATSLVESDAAVVEVRLTGAYGQAVFPAVHTGRAPVDRSFKRAPNGGLEGRSSLEESASAWRLVLPLSNRFERVGQLELIVPKDSISRDIQARFTWVLAMMVGMLVLGAALLVFLEWRGKPWRFTVLYTASFLLQAAISMAALGHLYSEGILKETESLAQSLGHRLGAATRLGLELTELRGIDELLRENMRRSPDIQVMSRRHGAAHAGPGGWPALAGGAPLRAQGGAERAWGGAETVAGGGCPQELRAPAPVEELEELTGAAGGHGPALDGAGQGVGFTGSQERQPGRGGGARRVAAAGGAAMVPRVLRGGAEPLLPAAALPAARRAQRASSLRGLGALHRRLRRQHAGAGRAAEAGQVRKLMTSGLTLSALAWMALAVEERWGGLIAIRCMGGLGQALLSAGAQGYVLKRSTGATKVRGSALIPSGYYGGVLSGMVIGALLGVYMGRPGVFAIASMTALLALGAVLIRIPKPAPSQVEPGPQAQPTPGLLRGLAIALRDLEMLRVLLLVGLPTRMIFAGLVMFALPLLLAGQQYAQEDIGQILMFYSLGVLTSNRYLSSGAGARVSTRTLLLLGLAGTGLGLGLTGQMEWSPLLEQVGLVLLVPLVPITGLMVLGMGHGLILNAGVAYAARVPGAARLGELTAASTYRAVERLGQVAGPTLAGVLLTLSGQRPVVLTWAGTGLLLFALLFLLGRKPTTA